LLKGKSPFVGGRDHTTHYLYYLGLSERKIALVYLLISSISAFLSIYLIFFIEKLTLFHIIILGAFVLIVFLTLYLNTIFTKQKEI